MQQGGLGQSQRLARGPEGRRIQGESHKGCVRGQKKRFRRGSAEKSWIIKKIPCKGASGTIPDTVIGKSNEDTSAPSDGRRRSPAESGEERSCIDKYTGAGKTVKKYALKEEPDIYERS